MTEEGAAGRMYVLYPTLRNQKFSTGTIRVWNTADRGKTWSSADIHTPVMPDHPRLVVDMSTGQYRGRVYVEWNSGWDNFIKNKYMIFAATSADSAKSFSEPELMPIGEGGKLVATEPLVRLDRTIVISYYQYYQPLSNPKNDHQPIWFVTSTDGGKTYSQERKSGKVGSSGCGPLLRDF